MKYRVHAKHTPSLEEGHDGITFTGYGMLTDNPNMAIKEILDTLNSKGVMITEMTVSLVDL